MVELDGWRFHDGRERANADREREQLLLLAGRRVIRLTRDQFAADPALCSSRLAAIGARPADASRWRTT